MTALVFARVQPLLHRALLEMSSGMAAVHVRTFVASLGPSAPAASVLAMVLMTFLPFPASPLVMANGAAFGTWEGLCVSVIGTVLSGCVAFGLGRSLGRSAARRFCRPAMLEWADRLAHEGVWISILALQAVPTVPHSLLNFLLGVTALSWTTFVAALAVSALPANAVFVLLGHGMLEQHGTLYWTLSALALLTIGSITVKRWLARHLGSGTPPSAALTATTSPSANARGRNISNTSRDIWSARSRSRSSSTTPSPRSAKSAA
jgi:uncharacterized membrane protein YdjX (TVP38/TMEM64 family)